MPITLPRVPVLSRLVLLAAVLLASPMLQSATLGPLVVHSALGQLLDAEVDISALLPHESDGLTATLAPTQAFTEAGVDYSGVLRSLRFVIEKKNDRTIVHITSAEAIHDPFITLLLALNASGSRIIRQYALLLDPPVLTSAQPLASSSVAPAVEPVAETVVEPIVQKVKAGDTLANIAGHIRPAGAPIESVMVALQRANPDAFIAHNMNRIKAGAVLRLPDAASMQAMDAAEVRKWMQLQTAEFQRYRQNLAQQAAARAITTATDNTQTTAAQTPEPTMRSMSGKTSAAPAAPEPGSPTEDKLHLSAAAVGTAKAAEAMDANSLDKIAGDKALAEANARIAALEKNKQDIEQVLVLKNQMLAELQAKPETAQPMVKDREQAWTQQWMQQASEDPLPLVAVLAVLVLLLTFVLMRRRRRHRHASAEHSLLATTTHAQTGVAQAPPVEPSNSVFHSNFVPSVSQLDTNEVDALAEADIYIAYGRDEQAEEILLDALRTHPQRHALRVKLLELYAVRKDKQKFGHLAADLHILTAGAGQEWLQAAHMGYLLDPGNLLYQPPLQAEAASGNDMSFAQENTGLVSVIMHHEAATSGNNMLDFVLPQPLLTVPNPVPAGQTMANETALQTKLELAQACQEIGDRDGARELLTEVAAAHHHELASKAKSLLGQLA